MAGLIQLAATCLPPSGPEEPQGNGPRASVRLKECGAGLKVTSDQSLLAEDSRQPVMLCGRELSHYLRPCDYQPLEEVMMTPEAILTALPPEPLTLVTPASSYRSARGHVGNASQLTAQEIVIVIKKVR
ncbi:hypothetical protein E2C01_071865 [Portunus trituberculatus]|uniref:Uncharacterized protein n=1 Tax=Portunus trituberculatus TaxID=210409 RepID=A0A5B7I118_PORTR|nr:hypothetical protein [Portunus trituberculatus]